MLLLNSSTKSLFLYPLSELQEVDLVLFHVLPISYFLVQFIFLFLFLAPRVRVSDDIGHMTRKVLEE